MSRAAKKSRHLIRYELASLELEVALLGALGHTSKSIAARIQKQHKEHMTVHMVQYRLSKARIKRSDYRNGTTEISEWVVEAAARRFSPQMSRELVTQFR